VALSVFGVAQFLGAFAGSACGGLLRGAAGDRAVFAACTLLALTGAGAAIAFTRREPA
jgi:hypothetical protein